MTTHCGPTAGCAHSTSRGAVVIVDEPTHWVVWLGGQESAHFGKDSFTEAFIAGYMAVMCAREYTVELRPGEEWER